MRHGALALALAVSVLLSLRTAWGQVGSTPTGGTSGKTLELDLGGGVKMVLVEIPAGEFQMGSPDSEQERDDNETLHAVNITKPYYMGRLEVTNAQFRRFRAEHHSNYLDGDNQPALWVSWYDAMEFCKWLSGKSGVAVRLPTEARWEYACRAGTKTRFYSGDSVRGHMDSADLAKVAWYGANSKGQSQDVGQKPPNAFGLHDMHGNAWEWCQDWFGADYYKNSPAEDPKGPEEGMAKVLRGGCYIYWTNYYCRSAHRYRFGPEAREPVTGFRVIVDPSLKEAAFPAFGKQPEERARPAPYAANTPAERYVGKTFGLPVVTVPAVGEPPKIDGKPDDGCWAKANPISFRCLTGRAGAPSQATTARVVSDAKNLYLAFDCAESDMKRLTPFGQKRDDPVWQGDTVELFLDPQRKEKINGYCHIAINPGGLTLDTKDGDAKWDPKLLVATAKSDKGWTVEAAIPFEELDVKSDGIPAVWGMNLTRYRPDIAADRPKKGQLVPHSWPIDEPEKFRLAEDTGWAKTYADTSHIPTSFGHAIFEVSKEKPESLKPARPACEIIAKEDFSSGTKGKFSVGEVADGGFMGGKMLRVKDKEVTIWQVPLKDFRDVHLLVAMKSSAGGVYWHTFSKLYGTNKCCARQVDTLTLDNVVLMPSFNYCDGAGRIDATSNGVADPYHAGYKKHLLWFSEPTIGHVGFAGPNHFAIVHTRLGQLQTQHPHNKAVDPDKDSIPGWFFHSMGAGDVYISRAVMFRGNDNVPPEKVAGLACKVEGKEAMLSWKEAADNTLTAWYRVMAGEGKDAAVVAEVADLSARLPLEDIKGRKLTVLAADYFENFSEPSEPVAAK